MNIEINKIYQGDCLEVLKTIPDNMIDCCITSPPYFNLRDYGVERQIGLEKTYQEYLNNLLTVFSEIKRVLKNGGTCFINLGDSYGGVGSKGNYKDPKFKNGRNGQVISNTQKIFQKSLMLIPERFAILMIDNGWILRNKLVWIKRNAIPESVNDRWKKAHEYIFFFVKNKNYYFNLDAIRTQHKEVSIKRAEYELGRNAMGLNSSSIGDKSAKYGMPARCVKLNPLGAVPPDFLDITTNCAEGDIIIEHYATYPQSLISPLVLAGCPQKGIILDPFFGSGTTGIVAKHFGCNYIGIELNPKYIKIAEDRLRQQTLL